MNTPPDKKISLAACLNFFKSSTFPNLLEKSEMTLKTFLNTAFFVNFLLEFGSGLVNLATGGVFLLPPRYLRESDGARLMSEMWSIAIMSMGLASLACWLDASAAAAATSGNQLKRHSTWAFIFYHAFIIYNTLRRTLQGPWIVDGPNHDENSDVNIQLAVIGSLVHTLALLWLLAYWCMF